MTMEIRVLDINEIEARAAEWEKILMSKKAPSPFCSLDLILPWMKHFKDEYSPLCIGFFDGGAAKGFIPLAISNRSLVEGRVLTFCGSEDLYSDHLDIIAGEDDSVNCLSALWDFLAGEELAWDLINLSLISKESGLMSQITGSSPLEWELKEKSTAPFIDLTQGFDSFLSGFNGKHRYTLRKKVNKLAEQGFSFRPCGDDQVAEGIETLFQLHSLRAVSKGIESTFCGEKLLAFHKEAARRLNSNKRLWLRFLEKDDKRIGAFYGFELAGKLFYYQFGIDPEWEPFSPGTVLMYKVIEEAFSRGLSEFDFLRGNESYKYGWTKNERPLYAARAYRKSFRGNLSKTVSHSKDFLKKRLKRLAGKA
jgi:CelD/BcsL family acetyltransferase involved in cellulose biosynthesis